MAATSPARIAANRANAARSTGPRTEAGKARSSRNAVTHGLAGVGVAPIREDQALVDRRAESWARELGAAGDLERSLVVEAAAASVRMRRADLTEAERADRRAEVARGRRSARARARLVTAAGVVRGWDRLAADFAATGKLSTRSVDLIAGLMGVPAEAPGGAIAPELLWAYQICSRLDRTNLTPDDRASTAGELAEWLDEKRGEAAERAEAARAEVEAAEVDPRGDAWFDTSPTGERLRRYRNAAERSLHRALARLERLRRLPAAVDGAAAHAEDPIGDDDARTDDRPGAGDDGAVAVPEAAVPVAVAVAVAAAVEPTGPGARPDDPERPAEVPAVAEPAGVAGRNEPKTSVPATTYGTVPIADPVILGGPIGDLARAFPVLTGPAPFQGRSPVPIPAPRA